MVDIVTYQPVKTFYVLASLGVEIVRLPFFALKYVWRYGRQHPAWTFRQALGVRLLNSMLRILTRIQFVLPLKLAPGQEKERFIVISPAHPESYKGPLHADIKPVEIGATWFPAPLTPQSDRSNVKVILHIHGGAFVMGAGRTQDAGFTAKSFLKYMPVTHVLSPQYRLSTLPPSKDSNPFPAALQDSLTSYLYLIHQLDISPAHVVISGDSAGATLAISLMRYIAEYGSDLAIPPPSACLLWSPWIDVADTSGSYVYDNANYSTDYICTSLTYWGTHAYAGLAGTKALDQPYVTHKNRPFKTDIPILVNSGGAEVLFFDNVKWYEQMKAHGNHISLQVDEYAPHDIINTAERMGFEAEAENAAKNAGEWLRNATK